MSKILCDVCGTSYPETAAQCPICGCVRPGEAQSVISDTSEGNDGYTYVKGGRFSKSNVRKRNKTSGSYEPASAQPSMDDDSEKTGNRGLVITAIVLLLAIIAVVSYILVQFFLPGSGGNRDTTAGTDIKPSGTTESTVLTVPCEKLKLNVSAITFDQQTAARMIYATAEPANTTDEVTFESSDEAVVTVNADGKVTAVGPGQATITVTCGDVTVECPVDCTFQLPTEDTTVPDETEDTTVPEEEFRLNRSDITFSSKGDSWMLYSGSLGLTQITWSSDDESVATITNGKVVAVGGGTTTVYAEYDGQKVSCIIRCAFSDSSEPTGGSSGNVTEDGGGATADGTYRLYNAYGNAQDVSITVGESFSLKLVDPNGNAVSGVTWSVSNEACCTVSDGYITGVSAGTATVTATYNGQTYSCIVRVN